MHTLQAALGRALEALGATVSHGAVLEGRSGEVVTVPVLAETPVGAFLLWTGPEDAQRLAALRTDLGADGIVAVGREAEAEGVAGWPWPEVARLLGAPPLREAGIEVAGPRWPVSQSPRDAAEALPPAFLHASPHPTHHAAPAPEPEPAGDVFDIDALADAAIAADHAPRPHMEPPATAAHRAATPTPLAPVLDADFPGAGSMFEELPATPRQAPPARTWDPQWDLDAPEPTPTIQRLPVLVTPRQARTVAQERLFAVERYELVLQPVHLFDAEVEVFVEGSLDEYREDTRLQVHGTDRAITAVDPRTIDASSADLLPTDHDIPVTERPLRVQPDRALELARVHLRDAFTRVVEVPAQEGDDLYAYTERRRVAPREDQIRLVPLGVFHRPAWRLLGPNGAMEVDAMTGEPLDAQVRSFPDAVLLD